MFLDLVLYVLGGSALFVGLLALHLRLERARRKREASAPVFVHRRCLFLCSLGNSPAACMLSWQPALSVPQDRFPMRRLDAAVDQPHGSPKPWGILLPGLELSSAGAVFWTTGDAESPPVSASLFRQSVAELDPTRVPPPWGLFLRGTCRRFGCSIGTTSKCCFDSGARNGALFLWQRPSLLTKSES
jgi:hypothetical protein